MRELRNSSAHWIRRAGNGERFIVTVDGRPTCQLGPIQPPPGELTLEDLASRGLLHLATRSDRPEPSVTMPLWAGTRLDQLVSEIRGR